MSACLCEPKKKTQRVVRENEDKGVTKRGTTLVFEYRIDKNVLC